MATVLVVDQGGIARRVIRTTRRMGMGTVIVSSEPSIERIVAEALASGAELVHPGAGSLVADPALARAIADAGLVLVGPPAGVLALCRSTTEVRAVARRAGIPVLPAGKAVRPRRRIDVQILADRHERVRALGERDRTAELGDRTIVEEAPAVHVTRWQRERLVEAATAMAHASGYAGAATVEFVLDERGDVWFIGLRPHLRPGHAVTEGVTGFDLVEQQLRIALGERLMLPRMETHGTAVAACVHAEEGATGARPRVRWPEGVRVDAGYSAAVNAREPLLGTVVTRADTRDAALDALADALGRTQVMGVNTNIPLLLGHVSHPGVRAGHVTTSFVERELASTVPRSTSVAPSG
jgi:acetyl/propionyl-CoA carboxylase alpha subunit